MSKKLLKYSEFLLESVTKRDKDYDLFNYKNLIDKSWLPVIREAQEFQHIFFDLENNDSTGEKKTIFIKQLLRKDQPVKTEINLELCEAGGDWEIPVYYFKIEFVHDHFISSYTQGKKPAEYVWDLGRNLAKIDSYMNKKYVLIPGPEDGNFLRKIDKGYAALDPNDESFKETGLKEKDTKMTDSRNKQLWKWIEDLMHDLAEKRHKMLDDSATSELSESKDTANVDSKESL